MNQEQISKLVDAATKVVSENGEDPNHTVGSAVLTSSGEIISGVNFYHFNGGPCAEVVTMASAVSQGKKDLVGIVAVADRNRGILAPCGRCRQTIIDYYPEMKVVIESEKVCDIKDLLPGAYIHADNQ